MSVASSSTMETASAPPRDPPGASARILVALARRELHLPALLLACVLFRLPVLLNANAVNSDAAVVGLQGWHMLRGEWSLFLWGAGYQSSIDAAMSALAFAVAGVRPIALATMPLIAHLVFVSLTWSILRKRLRVVLCTLLLLPLVFTPMALNIAFIYVARQWCIVTVFLCIWLLDGASSSRTPLLRYALGLVVLFLALCMDLFALQFTVGFGILALAACLDGHPRAGRLALRVGAVVAGTAVGYFIYKLFRSASEATSGNATLTLDRLRPNLELLTTTCLPWTLSAKVFANFETIHTRQWQAPTAFRYVQEVGAALLVTGMAFGGVSIFMRRIPWKIRRLAFAGIVVSLSSLGGFLVSIMPADAWSCRYLSPVIYMAPFTLAPAAYMLRGRLFGFLLSPYVLAVIVGGWISYGVFVDGPLPVRSRAGLANDEQEVARTLRSRDIHYAAAQYWLAYRMTLLFKEDPIVVPLGGPDRYGPYRAAFDKASTVAYLFHPEEPRATPEPTESKLRESGVKYEKLMINGFTVLIVPRHP